MKKVQKLVAVLLAIAMFVLVGCVSAFAKAPERTVKQYNVYTSLGDSIPAGIGLDSFEKVFERCEGAYPALVSEAVGAKKTNYLAVPGYRTDELRVLLTDDYEGDDITPSLMSWTGDGKLESIVENQRSMFRAAVKESDLITVNIGSNDLLQGVFFRVISASNESKSAKILAKAAKRAGAVLDEAGKIDAIATLKVLPTLQKVLDVTVKILSTATSLGEELIDIAQVTAESEVQFRKNFPVVIRAIKELNPKATVVVVGTYNGVRGFTLTKGSSLEIGRALDGLFLAMNNYMQYSCPYRALYCYADVWNTELNGMPSLTEYLSYDPEVLGDLMNNVHPNLAGHKQMAQTILQLLPKK